MGRDAGFSFVEVLIAAAISAIVLGAVFMTYHVQQRLSCRQEQVAHMQHNLRASMHYLTTDIRMAGFDPKEAGIFGITDVRLKNLDNHPADPEDDVINGSLGFSADKNEDGHLDGNETIYYCIFDYPVSIGGDGNLDLARRVGGGGRQLLSTNIQALGFAYAVDDNCDGILDVSQVDRDNDGSFGEDPVDGIDNDGDGLEDEDSSHTIWAVDLNNDNVFDINIDTNDDGVIDRRDDQDGDGDIDQDDAGPGAILPGTMDLDDIRAVRVWLLARCDKEDENMLNNESYVVGNQVLRFNDGFRRRLMTSTVACRNLGL